VIQRSGEYYDDDDDDDDDDLAVYSECCYIVAEPREQRRTRVTADPWLDTAVQREVLFVLLLLLLLL
jgi:hypothetical protein